MKKLKQLQNDFTTPEQSKRLLELGVPADSANIVAYTFFEPYNYKLLKHPFSIFIRDCASDSQAKFYVPCWSVGRLIEIINICSTVPFPNEIIITHRDVDLSIVKILIKRFEELVNYYLLDFSKLEE